MKIITWNCNMAFRKKAKAILTYKPDILIVPECECPEKLIFQADVPIPDEILWFGTNQNKGLGIFSYGHLQFKVHDIHEPEFKMIIPIAVTGGNFDFNLFAVWANNPDDKDGAYIIQVWKAINYYNELLKSVPSIIVGDFNSNTIWDRKLRIGNHTHVVDYLKDIGIHSCYHFYYNQIHGQEIHPTLYLYRHIDKPYHIDYCFISETISGKIISVETGEYDKWIDFSDHMPLMVTLD